MAHNKFYKHTVVLEVITVNEKLDQTDINYMVQDLHKDGVGCCINNPFLSGRLQSSKSISGPQAMRELRKMDYVPEEHDFDEDGELINNDDYSGDEEE
jgi:hypothetical protein